MEDPIERRSSDLAGLFPPPPGVPSEPPVPASRKRARVPVLVGVTLFFVVAAVIGIIALSRGGDAMPGSIDGVPRVTTDYERATASTLERTMGAVGAEVQTAGYGDGTTASFRVMVYEEPTVVPFDREFRAVSFSFMGTSGANLDPASAVDETIDGIHYRCESDPHASISICVMGGDRRYTALVMMESSGSAEAFALARKVHSATADIQL